MDKKILLEAFDLALDRFDEEGRVEKIEI